MKKPSPTKLAARNDKRRRRATEAAYIAITIRALTIGALAAGVVLGWIAHDFIGGLT